jgi:hypothetical protein
VWRALDEFPTTLFKGSGVDGMTLIKLTHANNGQTIYVAKELIAGFYHSPAHKCTHVVASGGAVFPAKENGDQIQALINQVEPTKE